MPKQKQQKGQQESKAKRIMTVDSLWAHMETNLSYKKFYYESLLRLGESSDETLNLAGDPCFLLCQQKLQPSDLEQLFCDLVLYRCDSAAKSSHILQDLRIIQKGRNSIQKNTATDRHQPWYQGYSHGSIDINSQLLRMMNVEDQVSTDNSSKNDIANSLLLSIGQPQQQQPHQQQHKPTISATSKRQIILALHNHCISLQQALSAILKYISVSGGRKQKGSTISKKVTALLRPIQPFLTPQAYQQMQSTLVSFKVASQSKDFVLLGYCNGAVAACASILKWTQLVVVQQESKKKKVKSSTIQESTMTAAWKKVHANAKLINLSLLACQCNLNLEVDWQLAYDTATTPEGANSTATTSSSSTGATTNKATAAPTTGPRKDGSSTHYYRLSGNSTTTQKARRGKELTLVKRGRGSTQTSSNCTTTASTQKRARLRGKELRVIKREEGVASTPRAPSLDASSPGNITTQAARRGKELIATRALSTMVENDSTQNASHCKELVVVKTEDQD